MKKLKHLDLFSGIGGFSLGLERTGGFETVAFCDNDKKTHLVLKKHWPNVPIFDDVSTLKGKDLGAIEIITGGFPCQDLSVAGKGAGLAGERSGLWWQFHRLIEETNPKYVIAENVAVLRSRGLDEVLRSLNSIGYDAEWHCIPASAVGAPHQRDRIWIVAYPNSDDGRAGSGSKSFEREAWMESRRSGERFNGESAKQTLADSGGKRLEGFGIRASGTESKESVSACSGCVVRGVTKSDFWEVEPELGRVADGIPNRVDRLKQLGNSLVPQIPELIGYAILQKENEKCHN